MDATGARLNVDGTDLDTYDQHTCRWLAAHDLPSKPESIKCRSTTHKADERSLDGWPEVQLVRYSLVESGSEEACATNDDEVSYRIGRSQSR
jgi:hypothetical protein